MRSKRRESLSNSSREQLSPLQRRRRSIQVPTDEGLLLHHDEQDGDKSSQPIPNFIKKVWSIVPFIEWLGFLKDHRKAFKENWIEAHHRPQDSGKLKEAITFMFEMELIFGSLIMSANASIFMDVYNESLVEDFTNFRLGTLGFWITLFGVITVQLSLVFVVVVYICLISLQPVTDVNFYTYLRTPSVQSFLAIPNLLLVGFLYFFVAFVCCVLAWKTGGSFGSLCLAFLPSFGTVLCIYPACAYHLNLGHSSGVFAPVRLIPAEKQVELTGEETERVLYWRAVQHHEQAHADPRQYYADIFATHAKEKQEKQERRASSGFAPVPADSASNDGDSDSDSGGDIFSDSEHPGPGEEMKGRRRRLKTAIKHAIM